MKQNAAGEKKRVFRPFGSRPWVLVLAASTLLGVMEAAQVVVGTAARGRALPWDRALLATLPSWYVLALLLPAVVWLAARFRFEPGRIARALLVHIPAALVFPIIHFAATALVSAPLLGVPAVPGQLGDTLARLATIYFVVDIFFYAALVGGYYSIDLYHQLQERALAASRLETSLAQANLQALKMQLQPHFLFNTLNAISVLAMKGENEAVVRMLGRLSDLLRATLENPAQMVRLEEELAFLERYLGIEQVRFQDRLTIETRVEPDVLAAEVPTLLLQPLVENAIRHGIARSPGAGRIQISAQRQNGALQLEVRDTGPGVVATRHGARVGVGLTNTRARLEQLYAGEYTFELSNAAEGGAVARVTIPYRPFTASEARPS